MKLISAAAALASCTASPDTPLLPTTISLSCESHVVKSSCPDPVLLSDYNILIYNCFGVLEESAYVSERESGAVFTTTLLQGVSYTVLAAANIGYALGRMSLEEAMRYRYYMAYPDEYTHGIPMAAVREGIVAGDVVNLKLERLMAEVDVYLDRSELDSEVNLSVKEIRVVNSPSSAGLFEPSSPVQYFSSGFYLSGLDLSPLDHGEPVRLFLLENTIGSSYIEIRSIYRSSTHSTRPGEYLIYRFRLDTSIGRNTLFPVVVRPIGDGLSSNDGWRIDASGLD